MDPRPILPPRVRRTLLGLAAISALGTWGALGAAAEPERSVDPTCPWGRLADGKGKLLRCLTRDEAVRLRDAPPSGAPALPAPSEASAPAPSAPPAPSDGAASPEPA